MKKEKLGLFMGYGIESEYVIVDRDTMAARPIADKLLERLAGRPAEDAVRGNCVWSNELARHVIELKANGPGSDLKKMQNDFAAEVCKVNNVLADDNAQLFSLGMHPFFNPMTETKVWSQEHNEIYRAYDRIFDCRGHGWSNLQSIHINLPFAGDAEFARLHAAIRLVLSIIPPLAASSPIYECRRGASLDNRLVFYLQNQVKVPTIIGDFIPENASSRREYETKILKNIYQAIDPFDPEKILRHEWLNSRGAIARFDRNAIEIRAIDIQECPVADFAIIAGVVSLVKALVEERWSSFEEQTKLTNEKLKIFFLRSLEVGDDCLIDDKDFLEVFGLGRPCLAREIWQQKTKELAGGNYPIADFKESFDKLTQAGSLAKRLLAGLGKNFDQKNLVSLCRELARCLEAGELFALDGKMEEE